MKSTRKIQEDIFTNIKIPTSLRSRLHMLAISRDQYMYQTIAELLVGELERIYGMEPSGRNSNSDDIR